MPILVLLLARARLGPADRPRLRSARAGEGRHRRGRGCGRAVGRDQLAADVVARADRSRDGDGSRAQRRRRDDDRRRSRDRRARAAHAAATRRWPRSTRARRSGADDHATELSTRVLERVSYLGDWPGVPLILAVLAYELRRIPGRHIVLFMLVVFIGNKLVTNGIKELVDRARPTLNPIAETLGPAFPSGHSSTAASIYAALALILARRREPPRPRAARGRAPAGSRWESRRAASSWTCTGSPTSSPASSSAGPGSRSARSRSAVAACASRSRWRPRRPWPLRASPGRSAGRAPAKV